METSRERILKAINHIQPETTPINLEGIYDPSVWYQHFDTKDKIVLRDKLDLDIQSARPVYVGPRLQEGLSIWGAPLEDIYGAAGVGYGSDRKYPLAHASTVTDIENFPWPDPDDFDYEVVPEVLKTIPNDRAKRLDGKYGLETEGYSHEELTQSGPWVPLVCTLFDMFGLEETLLKLLLEPEIIDAAVRNIEGFMLEFYRRLLEAAGDEADIVYFGDDFATQTGMMMAPGQWRRFFLPTYKKLFDLIRSHDKVVWMHSCGSFHPVMGDLIDAGLQVWETVQIQATGNEPERIKKEYGSHITFYGAISTQNTLPYGTEEDVRKEVRERISVLGRSGGYICGADHGIMPDVPLKNVLAMFDEARKYGQD
ncbi:MAG: uroporphyrinogen decarboxylase family protein [Bacteroidota bacterium]